MSTAEPFDIPCELFTYACYRDALSEQTVARIITPEFVSEAFELSHLVTISGALPPPPIEDDLIHLYQLPARRETADMMVIPLNRPDSENLMSFMWVKRTDIPTSTAFRIRLLEQPPIVYSSYTPTPGGYQQIPQPPYGYPGYDQGGFKPYNTNPGRSWPGWNGPKTDRMPQHKRVRQWTTIKPGVIGIVGTKLTIAHIRLDGYPAFGSRQPQFQVSVDEAMIQNFPTLTKAVQFVEEYYDDLEAMGLPLTDL
jgi:hypothetical protein